MFAERIAEKATMLQRVRQGSQVDRVPAAEVDTDVDLPGTAEQPTSATTAMSQSMSVGTSRASRRGLAAMAGLLATVALGTALVRWWSVRSEAHEQPTAAASIAPTAATLLGGDAAGVATPALPSEPTPPLAMPAATTTSSATVLHGDAPKGTVRGARTARPAAPKPAPTLW
jgi:hypothetical protein